jgi:hypothetical protein
MGVEGMGWGGGWQNGENESQREKSYSQKVRSRNHLLSHSEFERSARLMTYTRTHTHTEEEEEEEGSEQNNSLPALLLLHDAIGDLHQHGDAERCSLLSPKIRQV